MAQALSPELLNAVMQAESRGQRYDEKGRLLTSKKGAKGEMQVMDPTNLAPGFGVTPARDKSPDERARVGRDYLAAMVNRYPDRDTALMAYNWGPGNVDKWLKAGAPESKIPEETRNYVAKIDKMLLKDTSAKAPAPAPTPDRATAEMNKAIDSGISAQAPAPAVPAAAVVASAPSTPNVVSRTAAYGPSYQAALAVSMLGDEDEKEDKRSDEPTEAEKFLSTPTAATSLAKLDLSYASPFAEPEPVKMNKGGEAMAEPQFLESSPAARTFLNVLGGRREPLTEKDFTPSEQAAMLDVIRASEARGVSPKGRVDYGDYPSAENAGPGYKDIRNTLGGFGFQRDPEGNVIISDKYDFHGPRVAEYEKMGGVQKAASAAKNALMEFMKQGGPRDLAGEIGRAYIGSQGPEIKIRIPPPVKRAGGSPEEGEVALTPEEIAAASRPATVNPNIQRQGAAARLLASQRDVNTLPDPKTYAAVSGLLGQAPDEQGFSAFHPKAEGIRSAGETGFYAGTALGIAPVATALRAPAAALARSEQAKGALERMFPAAQPMYAVRPKGGAFMPEGQSTLDDFLSKYQKEMQESRLITDPEKQQVVSELLGKKARKYFSTQFGTSEDPIRKLVSEEKVKLYGPIMDEITDYELEAARGVGKLAENARRLLERKYDTRTRLTGLLTGTDPTDYAATSRASAAEGEKMLAQGLPTAFQNPNISAYSATDLQKSFQSPARQKLGQQLEGGTEPEVVRRASQLGEPVYDLESAYGPALPFLEPRNLVEGIAGIPTNKLKNMNFPDAVAEASNIMKFNKDFDFAVEAMREGRAYPKEMLNIGINPLLKVQGGQWVQLVDPRAAAIEGALMKHSAASYSRSSGKDDLLSGKKELFSLRGDNNTPDVTIQTEKTNSGKYNVIQIKGPYNSSPEAQKEQILQFIDKQPNFVSLPTERYSKTAGGQDLDSRITVDWAKEFDDWKLRQ